MAFDTTIDEAALDALHGTTAGISMHFTFEVGLLTGDPRDGGVELGPDGGYARITGCDNASAAFWPDVATDGQKVSVDLTLADATDAFSDVATHWGWFRTGETDPFNWGELDADIVVDEAGPVPSFNCIASFNLDV